MRVHHQCMLVRWQLGPSSMEDTGEMFYITTACALGIKSHHSWMQVGSLPLHETS